MFTKVLVANRGEIAVRIIRACRELGLETVAVFSEADRTALHVRYADQAYRLGPAPARQSYLRSERIVEIARESGAQAVHPGYGFLAERSDFAQACQDAGLVFIGPKPSAIAAMGDKAVARATVSAAGVPVVPGTEGEGSLRDEDLIALAPQIGFPLLIKATAGGGGRGMREVQSLAEMPALLHAARREAEAAFGDGNVYLEKLVEGAHHVEVQLLADHHGRVVHLGERECSLQRRHQKLVEESPSPFVGGDQTLRETLGRVAVRAAQAVEYHNAGTIEFLIDREKRFYFLEMNTRLQVEHTVTEMATGVDIVQEQIRIARGENLSIGQEDIRQAGWAIECRINAEDPYNDFLPSIGRVEQHLIPSGPGVRVDTGVYPGMEISPYYDPLISKLIVHGHTRPEAISRMRRALREYMITGISTNLPFHQKLLDSPQFIAGDYDTRFVEDQFSMDLTEEKDLGWQVNGPQPLASAIFATLAAHQQVQRAVQANPCEERSSRWKRWRHWKQW